MNFEEFPTWDTTQPLPESQEDPELPPNPLTDPVTTAASRPSVFPYDHTLNTKIVLHMGDITQIHIDAIVNSTNEALTDRSGQSEAIFRAAGPLLEEACFGLEGCRTGEAKSTRGYSAHAKRIIHTVGPRFNVKYQTAAENALHNCYRNCLQTLVEQELRSIAFCCINSERKGYPQENGAHIALRTIRRFLEQHGKLIDRIILVMSQPSELNVYQQILPLYFPRSDTEEQVTRQLLPEDTGNEVGETSCEERRIRIHSLPYDDTVTIEPSVTGFAAMTDAPDTARRASLTMTKKELEAQQAEQTYAAHLKRAQSENLNDIAKMRILYQAGHDSMGRPILVFIANHLPPRNSDQERVLLYMIREMDGLVTRDYVFVYVHTLLHSSNQPSFGWIRQMYATLFTRKYKKNLKALYVVHPTFWLKTLFFFLTPFVSKKFWVKLQQIDTLHDLYTFIPQNQLDLPDFVIQFDKH